MKVKNLLLSTVVFAGVVLVSACGSPAESKEETAEEVAVEETPEEISADVKLDQSTVVWSGQMLGMYNHEGTINLTAGNVNMTGDQVTGGSFTIDMTSIMPTDNNFDPANGGTPEKLVGHLSSEQFFDVANHPTATFEINGNNEGSLIGSLTVRGISNEESIENVSYDATTNTVNGTLTFDRKKYDVSYDMEAKDMIISDDIELNISLVL